MTMKNWPLSERPREKLLALGEKHLSNAELLAILFRTGIRGKTALDIAREMLLKAGGLHNLLKTEHEQSIGLSNVKRITLRAAIELAKRYWEEECSPGEIIPNSEASKHFFIRRLNDYSYEVFACLFLDNHQQIICFEELFHGTVNEINVYPREIVKRALLHNATYLILGHNHPSGHLSPSQADFDITKTLKKALGLIQVTVIDHIVVGNKKCMSFAERGLM